MARINTYDREFENRVYGSLAYDLTTTSAEEFYQEEIYEQQEAAPAPVVEERTRTNAMPVVKQSLAPTAVVGFICAAVLIVFVLMAQIQLSQISNETANLQSSLSELTTERDKLLVAYESAFNLTEIEEYATGVLGMQKPRSDQVFYVDGSAPDRAVVLQSAEGEYGLLDRFSDMIASLGEFFS